MEENDKEEEDSNFEMPEFDRKEYMKKQINEGKITLVSIAIAPIFSVISHLVFNHTGDWETGILAGLIGLFFLKPAYSALKLKVDDLNTKDWAKNFGIYSVTLLAVWILLMNPPFSDLADPTVNEIEVWIYDEEGELVEIEDISYEEEYNITIRAKITSNSEVKEDSVYITLEDDEENRTRMEKDDLHEHYYLMTYENVWPRDEPYEVKIEMEDVNGNTNTGVKEFYIRPWI